MLQPTALQTAVSLGLLDAGLLNAAPYRDTDSVITPFTVTYQKSGYFRFIDTFKSRKLKWNSVNWTEDHGITFLDMPVDTLFEYAFKYGRKYLKDGDDDYVDDLEAAHWLARTFSLEPPVELFKNALSNSAYGCADFEAASWLLQQFPGLRELGVYYNHSAELHTPTYHWLQKHSIPIMPPYVAFISHCEHGNLKQAQQTARQHPEVVTSRQVNTAIRRALDNDRYAFLRTEKANVLDVVQWLLSEFPDWINIRNLNCHLTSSVSNWLFYHTKLSNEELIRAGNSLFPTWDARYGRAVLYAPEFDIQAHNQLLLLSRFDVETFWKCGGKVFDELFEYWNAMLRQRQEAFMTKIAPELDAKFRA